MIEKRFINDIDYGQLIDTKGELSTIDYLDKVDFYELWEFLNKLNDENVKLKKENHELKAILQDRGMLISDEEIVSIRNEIADKFLKPLLKSNGFNVDIDTSEGFIIIPKGDVE